MFLEDAGRVVLLTLGAAMGIVGTVAVLKKHGAAGVLWSYVFCGALVGVGTFGPSFLESYGKFLDPILNNGTKESYQEFADNVASGKVPDKVARIGLEHMLANPVEGLDDLLKASAAKATTERRAMMDTVQMAHELNRKRSLEFAKTSEFKALPDAAKAIATRPLIDVKDEKTLQPTGLDRNAIRRLQGLHLKLR